MQCKFYGINTPGHQDRSVLDGRPEPTIVQGVLQHSQFAEVVKMKRTRLEEARARREKMKEERQSFFMELKGLQESKKAAEFAKQTKV